MSQRLYRVHIQKELISDLKKQQTDGKEAHKQMEKEAANRRNSSRQTDGKEAPADAKEEDKQTGNKQQTDGKEEDKKTEKKQAN